jgi:hypothetical protein
VASTGTVSTVSSPDLGDTYAQILGDTYVELGRALDDHWSAGSLPLTRPRCRKTVFWSPSVLESPNAADEIRSSAVYGFVFDFCGIEVDRDTGVIRIEKYVSLHAAPPSSGSAPQPPSELLPCMRSRRRLPKNSLSRLPTP